MKRNLWNIEKILSLTILDQKYSKIRGEPHLTASGVCHRVMTSTEMDLSDLLRMYARYVAGIKLPQN